MEKVIDCFVTFTFEMTNDGGFARQPVVRVVAESLYDDAVGLALVKQRHLLDLRHGLLLLAAHLLALQRHVLCDVHFRQRFWRELLPGCISIALQLHLLV